MNTSGGTYAVTSPPLEAISFTRLDVNASESLLNSKTISSDAKYKDIRWILLASEHDFKPCDEDFWKHPK